ncbi:MAG: hypothetical protein ACLGI3_14255 [Actinomycetes bacterium]
MTAALAGRPLLALLVACYVGVVLLVARFCGVGARQDREWIDLRDDAGGFTPCDNPRCPCRWEAS